VQQLKIDKDMSTKLLKKTSVEASERNIGNYTLLHEDNKTRITHWVIKPNQQTGWHIHEFDYVTIQQSYGKLYLEHADGTERTLNYEPGVTRSVSAPIEHNAINIGDVDIIVLEIEYKTSNESMELN
jgi:quercetin dioxygenase-like cupin family protein|tara:strand:+ start:1486 stop:1866 length:381 start_codon:yes stop_codon:yes gene_type:complete